MHRWLLLVLVNAAGCNRDAGPPRSPDVPPSVEPMASTATRLTQVEGMRLVVVGAPDGTTLTVEASDTRLPLVAPRPLGVDEQLELEPGFLVVTLRAATEVRLLQLYAHEGAQLHYQWREGSTDGSQAVTWLDRAAVQARADTNFDALMAAVRDESKLKAVVHEQRTTLEALEPGEPAYLSRLLHASNAIQITGPDDALEIIAPIPANAIAWAAYSDRFVELRMLFGDHEQARARFEAVRARVQDRGLATAFAAGDLYEAERSGKPDGVAEAYAASMSVQGPPKVGEPMPAFKLIDLDTRRAVHNEDLLGTPYFIEVWSTWCKPCIKQMPALHALHHAVSQGGEPRLRIISVAVNGTRAAVEAFRHDHWPMPWTNVWAPDGAPVFQGWDFSGVPYAVLVDAQGVVLGVGSDVTVEQARSAAN